MPTLNRPAMLKRAIESCIAQSEPCEVVVIDDHSTKETAAIATQFPRITYLRNDRNLGHPASVNLGIQAARGSWIKHLDDDDFLRPDCLAKITDAILRARQQGHDPRIATCVATNVDRLGKVLSNTRTLPIDGPAIIKREDLLAMMMCDQAPLGTPVQVAHERRVALDVGGWNVDRPIKVQRGEEVEAWIRLASRVDAVFLPEALGFRTRWAGNQMPPIHVERAISLYLKQQIADQLAGAANGEVPRDILCYLDIHWGLVALKRGKLRCGLGLMMSGMRHSRSYRNLWARSRFTDAMRRAYPLD